jgi:hypothetical protein
MVVPNVVEATIVAQVQHGMEFSRDDLRDHQRNQQGEKDECADQIAPIERHGDGIAAGLAERRRRDLDHPERERDLRNLAQHRLARRMSHADLHLFCALLRGFMCRLYANRRAQISLQIWRPNAIECRGRIRPARQGEAARCGPLGMCRRAGHAATRRTGAREGSIQ